MPFEVDVDGERLEVPVLLEGHGSPRGMLLFELEPGAPAQADRLVDLGYGWSCLTLDDMDDEALRAMLADWGPDQGGDVPS